jgi:hypothetical protein
MDERVRLFAWIAGSGGFFGLLGAGFGALAGLLQWRAGRAVGTAMGLGVARAFERAAGQAFSPTSQGALVGAVDGFSFLAVVGVLLGAIAGYGQFKGSAALSIAIAVLLLIAGALFFGGLAYAFSSAGSRGAAALFIGAVACGSSGFWLASIPGLLIGVIGGGALGILCLLFLRRFAPSSRPLLPEAPQRWTGKEGSSDTRFKTDPDRQAPDQM